MRKNKKGFTLVELVIVIAVIAILAAVLLPTFAGIVTRARLSSVTQRAESVRKEVLGQYYDTVVDMQNVEIKVFNDGKVYTYTCDSKGKMTNDGGVTGTLPTTAANITNSAKFKVYGTDVTVIIPNNYTTKAGDVHTSEELMHFGTNADTTDLTPGAKSAS